MCKNNFLKQESFLKEIQDTLTKLEEDTTVFSKLNELRSSILRENKLRFYMCADMNKLSELYPNKLDSIWLEQFPSDTSFDNRALFTSNTPFRVQPGWMLKKTTESQKDACLFTPLSKRDYIINLGTSESSYLRLVASLDINSYDHPNYAALLVLIEYFCQTEVFILIFFFFG